MTWGVATAAAAVLAVAGACTTTHGGSTQRPAPAPAVSLARVSDGDTTFTVRSREHQTVISAPGRGQLVIPDRYVLPRITADGAVGGLAHDGTTLALGPGTDSSPSRFALVDTRLDRPPTIVRLAGEFSFDALSRTGSMLYVIQHLPPANSGRYAVRVYDVARKVLQPAPVADKRNVEQTMSGYPMARATSRDGTWVFTLYQSTKHPFVHALNVDGAYAICLDLPHTAPDGNTWRLTLSPDGGTLHAVHDGVPATVDVRRLLAG
jgi:hypothetical protein